MRLKSLHCFNLLQRKTEGHNLLNIIIDRGDSNNGLLIKAEYLIVEGG